MYITKEQLTNYKFHQVPSNVMDMFYKDEIKATQFKVYTYMFDLLKMSSKNPKYIDRKGNPYVAVPYENIMEKLNLTSKTTVSNAIKGLEKLGLIYIKKSIGCCNLYYFFNVLTPVQSDKTEESTDVNGKHNNTNKKSIIEMLSIISKDKIKPLDLTVMKVKYGENTVNKVIKYCYEKSKRIFNLGYLNSTISNYTNKLKENRSNKNSKQSAKEDIKPRGVKPASEVLSTTKESYIEENDGLATTVEGWLKQCGVNSAEELDKCHMPYYRVLVNKHG